MKENMDIFKFDLAKSDMTALGKLDRNKQYTSFSALSYVICTCDTLKMCGKKLIFILYLLLCIGTDEAKGLLPTMIDR